MSKVPELRETRGVDGRQGCDGGHLFLLLLRSGSNEIVTIISHKSIVVTHVRVLVSLGRVVLLVPRGGHVEDVPLDGEVELGEVDPGLDHVGAADLVQMFQVELRQREKKSKCEPVNFGCLFC